MLRRAKLLHAAAQQRQSAGKQVHGAEQQKESAAGSSTDAGVKRKRQLDLRGSPLMRLAASQVGRGAAASTFGDVARAACSEAGTKNVSSGGSAVHLLKFLSCALQLNACMHIHIQGTRSAAAISVGANKHNAERDIMAALRRSHGVPCRC